MDPQSHILKINENNSQKICIFSIKNNQYYNENEIQINYQFNNLNFMIISNNEMNINEFDMKQILVSENPQLCRIMLQQLYAKLIKCNNCAITVTKKN